VGCEGWPPAHGAGVGGVEEVGPVGRHQGDVDAGDDEQGQLPRLTYFQGSSFHDYNFYIFCTFL
jgi:hypothetical protein